LNSIRFLSIKEVEQIFKQALQYSSGPEICDQSKLIGAIYQPMWANTYGVTCLKELAAHYLYYIAKDHPFVDGNKRVAVAAALTFLKMNAVPDVLDHRLLEAFAWRVADEPMTKEECVTGFVNLFSRELL
jgi:death-on-curing protein